MDMFNFAKNPPKWMDQSFFEKVIRQTEKDPKAQVENFNLSAGSKPGDNFSSSLFRGLITFKSKYTKNESKTLSVIIKVQMSNTEFDFLKDSPMFRNEMEMYGKVLPEIQSLWLSACDKNILCPKLIYQSNDPAPVIILEDVSVEGFGIIEQPPEDFEVSKQIARRLAKFHAATFFLKHEQRLDYSDFSMNLFQNPLLADIMFDQNLQALIDVAKEWDGYEKFISHLESFRKAYLSKALQVYTPNRNEFGYNVLNHADFHLKNMLFKKTSAGAVEDFYIIDYQISVYATPAIDLIYALYFFVSAENRKKHRAEFITTYHQQFVEALKKFGYLKAPPSLIDLNVELLRNGTLEVLVATCMCMLFYFDFSNVTAADMDMGEGTKEAKRRIYRNPDFEKLIKAELPRFLHNGII